jgi:hypothetical protein
MRRNFTKSLRNFLQFSQLVLKLVELGFNLDHIGLKTVSPVLITLSGFRIH